MQNQTEKDILYLNNLAFELENNQTDGKVVLTGELAKDISANIYDISERLKQRANHIDMVPVISSNVHSVGYSEERQVLRVSFKGKTINTYDYYGVPRELVAQLMSEESIGKAFNYLVKSKNFRFDKIEDLRPFSMEAMVKGE